MKLKRFGKQLLMLSLLSSTSLFAISPAEKTIDINSTINDAISHGGEVDLYKFTLKIKSKVSLYTEGSVDTYGYLLNSKKSAIADDDDNGANANFKIDKTLNEGTYYIRVRGYDQSETGAYKLTLKASEIEGDKDGSTIDKASHIWVNSDRDAKIDYTNDIDVFKIRVGLKVEEGKLDIETTGSIDTYCYLLNSDGNIIAEDDDGGKGTNCHISEEIPGHGNYYIKIRGYSKWDTGKYKLHNKFKTYDDDHGDTFDTATPIEAKTAVLKSMINYNQDEDYFTFILNEKKRVRICYRDMYKIAKLFDSNKHQIDRWNGGTSTHGVSYCHGIKSNIYAFEGVLNPGKYYILSTGIQKRISNPIIFDVQ